MLPSSYALNSSPQASKQLTSLSLCEPIRSRKPQWYLCSPELHLESQTRPHDAILTTENITTRPLLPLPLKRGSSTKTANSNLGIL